MSGPLILGLNCAHDASACLIAGGHLQVAIAEERLTRRKHQRGFPVQAIRYCLEAVGLDAGAALDGIAVNQEPPADFSHQLKRALPASGGARLFINPSHHLLHACYAFAASGFEEAVVLIADGSGYSYGEYLRQESPLIGQAPPWQEACEAISMFDFQADGAIQIVAKQWGLWRENSGRRYRFPSLGHMYSLAAQYIFGAWQFAGKVMGLAPYGDSDALDLEMVRLTEDGVQVNTDWILELPEPLRGIPPEEDPLARNLAARVQAQLERAMFHLADLLAQRTGRQALCLSGGVALNSVCNGKLLTRGPFKRLFITPAAMDAGVAIGAAAFCHHRLTGQLPLLHKRVEFLGRSYRDNPPPWSGNSLPGLAHEPVASAARQAAQDIAAGLVVAWFEGGSEFGPRALGHRSILADPRNPRIKDHLNAVVKFRESFRPYAAAILENHCSDWFCGEGSAYMLLVLSTREQCRDRIPGVVHVDGSCRIQTVADDYPGQFYLLLRHFHQLTGVPLVLNTSFNVRGEPICETPADALRCFTASGIDVLYLMGRRFVKSPDPAGSADPVSCIPVLDAGCRLECSYQTHDGSLSQSRWALTSERPQRLEIEKRDADLLLSVNGCNSIAEIAASQGTPAEIEKVAARLCHFRDHGLLYFRERAGEDAS